MKMQYKRIQGIIIPKSELGQNWVIKLKHFICIHVGQWAQYRYHLIYQESKCVMLRRKISVPRPMVVRIRDISKNPEIHFIRDFTLSTRPATPGPLTEITGSEDHLTAHLIRHRIFPETLCASRDWDFKGVLSLPGTDRQTGSVTHRQEVVLSTFSPK